MIRSPIHQEQTMTVSPRRELLVSRFDDAQPRFEGLVLGALERAESGGAIRVVEVLVIGHDPDSGELAVLRAAGGGGRLVDATTRFRLDASWRRKATASALAAAGPESSLSALAAELPPDTTIVAVLVEHAWQRALDDAVARAGGRRMAGVDVN